MEYLKLKAISFQGPMGSFGARGTLLLDPWKSWVNFGLFLVLSVSADLQYLQACYEDPVGDFRGVGA